VLLQILQVLFIFLAPQDLNQLINLEVLVYKTKLNYKNFK